MQIFSWHSEKQKQKYLDPVNQLYSGKHVGDTEGLWAFEIENYDF